LPFKAWGFDAQNGIDGKYYEIEKIRVRHNPGLPTMRRPPYSNPENKTEAAIASGVPDSNQPLPPEEHEFRLVKLQRREWSLWGTALLIMLCLTAGLATLSFTAAMRDTNVLESVVGLMIIIVLFGCYSTYEKFLINRLRLEAAQNHLSSATWREVALIDPLTALPNRRYVERRLKEEILRSQRKGYPLTLVAFDLNDFKQINDEFGHEGGDSALKLFAACLRNLARETDVAARLAGDEFVLLLTECDAGQAAAMVKRLPVESLAIGNRSVAISFSAGWTQYRPGDQSQDMMRRADELLYQDKERRKMARRKESEPGAAPLVAGAEKNS
jgi:diguanylate cyclase (GGDEF)-like protein